MKSNVEWVVMGGKEGELGYCTRCGVGLSLSMPQPIPIVVAASKAFVKIHAKCAPGKHYEKPPVSIREWHEGRDTGISSKTIAHVLGGTPLGSFGACPPSDPADFGRCYRLLALFPAWKERLSEVSVKYPRWCGLIEHWQELTALYEEEIQNKSGLAPKLYARMKELLL